MQKRDYVAAAFITLVGAIVLCVISFAADYKNGPKEYGWFARSGGLVVLAAVVLEYQLWVRLYLRNSYQPGTQVSLSGLAQATNLPVREQRMKNTAHSAVAVGTLIWAYGDLTFKLSMLLNNITS